MKRWFNDRSFGFITPKDGAQDVYVHWKHLLGTKVLKQGDTVPYETLNDECKGKCKTANYIVISSVSGGKRDGGNDEMCIWYLWDLWEKYWASSHHGESGVIDDMWSLIEDPCNAPQCPDIYGVVRRCVYELVQAFNDMEEEQTLTEEWSELVRDTLRKHRMDAESQ